uniref:Ammonium transporter n=1 Tax=Sexangularia sp. CB-2014 TaxID=1486929 RepID=A0A7S1V763_9EUKA|mmetsp:Transcript_13111/g.41328  ORF Transcript_13111/g.41328 Transcript_13111/m.41328 type:complete len:438 (+) Transcript_13111:172-1485(+)
MTDTSDIQTTFTLSASIAIFSMQLGFSCLEAGACRARNTRNILLKNLLDCSAGALVYTATGFAFAYGTGVGSTPFLGIGPFLLWRETRHALFFYSWTFAATAATIVSGAMAERTQFAAYRAIAIALHGFIYPAVVHWVWTTDGFLARLGYYDFAGGTVVHVVGGMAGLVGAMALGPRIGRFPVAGSSSDRQEKSVVFGRPRHSSDHALPGHSATLTMLGGLILWVGFYAFNCGSGPIAVAPRVAVVTTLCASAGTMVALTVGYIQSARYSLGYAINGALAGLVSATSVASVIEPWSAIFVGGIGALLQVRVGAYLVSRRIDDPLEVVGVHFVPGFWSVLAVALFAVPEEMGVVDYPFVESKGYYGLLYGGSAKFVGVQLLGALAITGWTILTMGTITFALRRRDLLRVPTDVELAGLDAAEHDGSAYPEWGPVARRA